ncbi:citramalate synthase [bacterium]|nr:citramalate synthase [bacterium]
MATNEIKIYDTTLRDGAQGEGIAFSVEDKVRIAQRLDEFGLDYIEGGWPGSNPKDAQFFERARAIHWKHAKITAFGSTRRAKNRVENDPNIRKLLDSHTQVVTIFGKSWDLHVKDALKISLEKNLELIRDSIAFLKQHGRELIYDAEHFFDGFRANPEYAITTLKVAQEAGADCIVLCDTNGGTITTKLMEIIKRVQKEISTPLGIHAHNDCEMAVANSLAAVELGITHVQGTINGYGERCGNANLCSIIPNLKLKLTPQALPHIHLQELTAISRYVSEIANLPHCEKAAYVGKSAFAHKGGVHVDAVRKNPITYEHIIPEIVGNQRRILVSDLSGKSNILLKAEELGLNLESHEEKIQEIVGRLKELEHLGYQFEGADASFEILVKKSIQKFKDFFNLEGFRVIIEKRVNGEPLSEATIKVRVGDKSEHTAAEGNGPVNALDNALRKALEKFFPALRDMQLTDYKVRVLDEKQGTGAKVRVLIESSDKHDKWGTVGVSENIIEASWQALVDSISYKLMKNSKR